MSEDATRSRRRIDWSLTVRWVAVLSMCVGVGLCVQHDIDEHHRRDQERLDKCVEQTGDAKFCWEKYG